MTVEPGALRATIAALPLPADGGWIFSAADVPGAGGLRVGRSRRGVALLVPLTELDEQLTPIELRNLEVRPNVLCRTSGAAGVEEGLYTVCLCTASDERLRDVFVDALQLMLVDDIGDARHVRILVERLIELFSGLTQPPRTSLLGLWGELFVMYVSGKPDVLLDSWHAVANERYDFAVAGDRLEVKTAVGRRVHSFSLEQLEPPTHVRLAVASIVTESSAAGTSVPELLGLLASRCARPDASGVLLAGAAQALGSEVSDWGATRFDVARARDSLLVVDGRALPRPRLEAPEVYDVQFKVDLSSLDVPPAANSDLVSALTG